MIEKQRIKLAFYTNFDNHHQIPLADELYRIYGNSYIFITRENIPKGFLRKGYHHYDRPYILRMETSEKNTCLAKKILMEAEFASFWRCSIGMDSAPYQGKQTGSFLQ